MRVERARLNALKSYKILDTAQDPAFDRLVSLAADLLEAPIALISLVDDRRQWFKARFGLDLAFTPREQAFCAHALALEPGGVLVVEDAMQDPLFSDNPLVVGPPHVRFYAGAVLTDKAGHNLGTICVLDRIPRQAPTPARLSTLKTLAAMAVDAIEDVRETARLAEQQRLIDLSEAISGVGRWHLDLATKKVTWSDEVYRIHGVAPGAFELNYDRAVAFYCDGDEAAVRAEISEAVAKGLSFQFQRRIRRADGDIREVVSSGRCELSPMGEATAIFGVVKDVTDDASALRAAGRSEASYKLLSDHVADVIARFDFAGESGFITPSIRALLGYEPFEMRGQTAQAFVFEPDQPLILSAFEALSGGQDEITVQHRARHKQGYPIWVETRLRLIRDEVGLPSEIIAVIRDISERKALEGEMIAAREAAVAAATAKADFLANMSHELRTPLTSIIGFTALAAAEPNLPGRALDFIKRVENAGRVLLYTVNDILDFSGLERGHVRCAPELVDLIQLVRTTMELLTPQAAAKDIDLILDLSNCGAEWIMIDPNRVRQVLINLIGNALKFTERGTVTVQVRYRAVEGALWVCVADTGPGIAPEKRAQLFQRFSQIDGSLSRAHGGAGLGLAICKGIVEAIGGTIDMDSVLGEGSRFWFTAPAPAVSASRDAPPPVNADFDSSNLSILVVDDHHANRELARLFLMQIGAEVVEAEDGLCALARASERVFDLILMDVRMPNLDGPSTLARLRAAPGLNQSTPILAYTAEASLDDMDRLRALGFKDVVSKPVQPAALVEAVIRALQIQDTPEFSAPDLAVAVPA